MRDLLESATLKLTAWYLLIIMTISLTFSAVIYQLSLSELAARFDVVQSEIESVPRFDLPSNFFGQVRQSQSQAAAESLALGLAYINLFILMGGGLASYLLARRTLKPVRDANESQMRFVADASHQLRTPLAIMRAELEAAARSKRLTRADIDELITSSLEEVDSLSDLSHKLLELSRLDNDTDKPAIESVPLSDLAAAAVKRHNKRDSRLILVGDKDIEIKANRRAIEELIDILIDNAFKYSPPGSKVEVVVSRRSRLGSLTISNTGDGIPAEDLPHIFDRFYRSSVSQAQKGYGLGLALAKQIAEVWGGQLSVTSQPGGPTSFVAEFNLA